MANTTDNEKFWGFETCYPNTKYLPDDTAKGLLLFIIFQTILSLLFQCAGLLGFNMETGFLSYAFSIVLDLCFVFAVVVVSNSRDLNMIENVGLKTKPTLKQILLCLGLSVVCIFGFSGVTNVFLQFLYNQGYASVSSDIVIPNFGMYIAYTLFICVLPAFCEEILFRGLIFNGLKKINTTTAVLGSAFLFMLMHGSPDQTVHQFILGIVLAVSLLLTNTIWVPMLIHFFNNFIAVTYTYICYGDSAAVSESVTEIYFGQYILYALLQALVGVLITVLIFKSFVKISKNKKASENIQKLSEGTIDSELKPAGLDSEISQETDVEERMSFYRPAVNPNKNNYKLSKQGKWIYAICIGWMTIDWLLMLFIGFGGTVI